MHVPILFLLLICIICVNAAKMSTKDGLEYLEKNKEKKGVITTASGLQYKVLSSPNLHNPAALSPNVSSTCHVHYRGTTIKGFEFDSSYKRGKPTQFAPQDVIQGWKEALMKMREGDKWQLVIPAELAYGKRNMGEHISPGSVLVFEVELVKVDVQGGGLSINFIPKFLQQIPYSLWVFVLYFLYQIFSSPEQSGAKKLVPLKEVTGSMHNDKVFMEVQVGDTPAEKIEFELFTKHCPKTCANFLHLCKGDKGVSKVSGKPLTYKDSIFHRVIPGFMVQGGDFTLGNGRGGESVYGETFEDEWTNGYVPHEEPYLLSMANAGANTNGSQFFITLAATAWLDKKHVVFGKVTSGLKQVDSIRAVGSSSGRTHAEVKVTDCGVVTEREHVPVPAAAKTAEQKKNE